MIPKFQNSHILSQNYNIVDRSDIFCIKDDSKIHFSGYSEALASLETRIRSQVVIDENQFKSPRKHLKQAESHTSDAQDFSPNVSFRLVSSAAVPKSICIEPKLPPALKPIEPSYEDNDDEASLRKVRAESVAIGADWLLKESRFKYPKSGREKLVFASTNELLSSPLLVAKNIGTVTTLNNVETQSNEKKLCCPIMPITVPGEATKSKDSRQHRRRFKKKVKIDRLRPRPQFYRPEYCIQSKCLGYAWGYTGSRPILKSQILPSGYVRDRMKRGVSAERLPQKE